MANIQSESSQVTKSLREGYVEVEKGTNQIQTTGEAFNDIQKAVQDMVVKIQTVTSNLAWQWLKQALLSLENEVFKTRQFELADKRGIK